MNQSKFIRILLITFVPFLLSAQQNLNQDDVYWSNIFAHPGLFNRATTVTNFNSTTAVFAGHFELPNENGGFESHLLAFWDGLGWKIEGTGDIGTTDIIRDICVIGNDVYIGGSFTIMNSSPISFIAKWDGLQWSQLGQGLNGPVYALETDGTNLYVGGGFTLAGGVPALRIAKWDGNSWSSFRGAQPGVVGNVNAIAIDADAIYIGGDFYTAGGIPANFLARYNSSGVWQAMDIPWDIGSVNTIGIHNGTIYVGGNFITINGWPGNGIIRRSGGGSWESMGNGSPVGVSKLMTNSSGEVFARGDFSSDGGPAANRIAKWNGTTWEALGAEPLFPAGGFIDDFTLFEPNIIYTTSFSFENPNYLYGNGIYKWDGVSWSGLGNGIGDYWTTAYSVKSLAYYNSKLVAGGNFITAGDKFITSLAQFDGDSWYDIGGNSTTPNNFINKLFKHEDKLYAGGSFTNIGGANANNIAVWNGSSWSALGTGVDNTVETIQSIGNDIYVSGGFFNAGGSPAVGYARWDGSTWHPLANGGPSSYTMTNIGNDLFVGGQFNGINGGTVSVNNLARWDGTNWYDVGGGVTLGSNFITAVYALAARGNELIVGGNFSMAGTTPANNIAIWNGSQWSTLGNGLNGDVRTILVSGNNIYVGGQFTSAGSNAAYSIARWDGTNWYPLGRGINQSNNAPYIATVYSLLDSPEGLYVGGQFTHAGDKYSNMIALYTDLVSDVEEIDHSLPTGFNLEQNYPNPFNPNTTIRYTIPNVTLSGAEGSKVQLKVYDVLGNKVATLVDESKPAGTYEANFNASELTSGIYFYKLQTGSFIETKKMMLLK